ncbi:toxin VasX [Pseudomonas sp. GL-B-19]|uniref:toxin VasX n=1 Tax=Pseudomonas sp. GL-B-19 TaxID=2832393 RepID=UPI001CBF55A3|nr:toxin VasX [Pseudomonas sp. GL-B-19]
MSTLDPARFGTCPIFAAVLPLRYALGPTTAVDTSAYDLPALQGHFPELGPRHPDLSQYSLNYTSRLLRNGWLYVWESNPPRLVEYQVEVAQFKQTPRAGKVIDDRVKPHLVLRAGDPAGLVWSPTRWSEPQYLAAKTDPAVRQRIMRSFVPGIAPFSAPVGTIAKQIGEYSDATRYGWSGQPETEHAPDWLNVLKQMARCEQQAYAVIDDAWGVLLDLAALMRARKAGFDSYQEHHAEKWAMASVLKSLSEGDRQLSAQLPSITRYDELQRAWKDQDIQNDRYTADTRRLAQLWVAWFNTLQIFGPSSMDTACGHFDITQAIAREALELHFAEACLGPASTSVGAEAITLSLDGDRAGKPWLLWALLGLPLRLGVGEIKYLVDFSDVARDNQAAVQDGASKLARAFGYADALNKTADKLKQHKPASSLEALFLAIAPVAALQLHQADNATSAVGRVYMAAALARSDQRIQTSGVTPRQMGEWFSDLMGTRQTLPAALNVAPVASGVADGIPFMHLVPASTKLPPLPVNLAANVELSSVFELKSALSKAPIKSIVTLVAGVNFASSGSAFVDKKTVKNGFAAVGAAFGVGAAGAAVWQRVGEVNWEMAVRQTGKFSVSSRLMLIKTLGRAAITAGAQVAVLAFDVVIYGIEAFEAYQKGDFDTMATNLAIASAELAGIVLYVKLFRAYRAAQVAVMIGKAAAIAGGMNVAPHVAIKILGLTLVIVTGVIARLYTADSPLEQWVKNSRFGISPDDTWSNSYTLSMEKLYPILFPISFDARRLAEMHPYQGQVTSTYLMLKLPGENVPLPDTMIHFKGIEVWGDTLGYHSEQIKKVEWTGKDFALHSGSRIPVPVGITPYRRVYHENGVRDLKRIEGELIYSPQEGLTLPAVKIMERAWI